MVNGIRFLAEFGAHSLISFWIPVAIWTLVSLFLFLTIRSSKRLHAHARYLMSTALIMALPAGFLVMPIVSYFGFSLPEVSALHVLSDVKRLTDAEISEALVIPSPDQDLNVQRRSEELWTNSGAKTNLFGFLVSAILTILVIIAVIVSLIRFGIAHLALLTLKSGLSPVKDETARIEFRDLRHEIGVRKSVRLMVGPVFISPLTYGWRNPVIVLPSGLTGEHAEDRRISIIHELIHIRRHDCLVALIIRIICIGGGWHPLVLLLKHEVDLQRELACDADLIDGKFSNSPNYARTLVRASELTHFIPALSMSSSRKNLTKRIEAMNQSIRAPRIRQSRYTVLVLTLLFLLIPTILTACMGAVEDAGPEKDSLMQLETEVAYLDHEIVALYEEIKLVLDKRGVSLRSEQYTYVTLKRRKDLLESMREERSYALEEKRMQVAVAGMLEDK